MNQLSKNYFSLYFRFQPSNSMNTSYFRMNVLPMSKLNIICPNNVLNPVKLQRSPGKDHLYENLWIVDKQSFDSCEVNTSIPTNRLLYQCDQPLQLKYYLLVFLDVSPSVHSLEFVRGKDYYFICKYWPLEKPGKGVRKFSFKILQTIILRKTMGIIFFSWSKLCHAWQYV